MLVVCLARTLAVHVTPEARRSILVDLLTVHALGGKAIVFTQTKREADEVAASVSLVHPCEVGAVSSLDIGHLSEMYSNPMLMILVLVRPSCE